jgi:transposase-like protein
LVRGRDLRQGGRPLALCLPCDRPVRPGHRRVRLLEARRQGRPRFLERAITTTKITPVEVVTDKAATYPTALGELLPAAWHRTDQYANNYIEADHGRLKARLGPMRGLKQDRSAKVVIAGHAFVQNVRRGHYELAVEEPATRRVAVAFDELALAT